MTRLIVCCVAASLLAACITPSTARPNRSQADWVGYALTLRALDTDQLNFEYRALEQQHTVGPSSDTAIRLALISADPRAQFHDFDRSLGLFAGVARDASASAGDIAFAELMRGVIGEIVRLESTLARERDERAALRRQLEALIALEERLNQAELE